MYLYIVPIFFPFCFSSFPFWLSSVLSFARWYILIAFLVRVIFPQFPFHQQTVAIAKFDRFAYSLLTHSRGQKVATDACVCLFLRIECIQCYCCLFYGLFYVIAILSTTKSKQIRNGALLDHFNCTPEIPEKEKFLQLKFSFIFVQFLLPITYEIVRRENEWKKMKRIEHTQRSSQERNFKMLRSKTRPEYAQHINESCLLVVFPRCWFEVILRLFPNVIYLFL